MKNKLWAAVYDTFTEVDALLTRFEKFGSVSETSPVIVAGPQKKPAPKAGAAGPLGLRQAYSAADDLVQVRAKIRSKLDQLKAALAESLTEREGYLVLFAVVVFLDETVNNRFVKGQGTAWPPLQKELFRVDDGGALFYDTLDDVCRKADTLPFIYETYYYCLSEGFRGKYADNLAKINEYKHKLEEKIPVPKLEKSGVADQAPDLVRVDEIPFSYYAAAAGFIAAAWLAFTTVAGL
jgi:type IV/VI secretion system ImpK/VasF family protein